jgi:chemotaxis-related protein WspB
VAGIFNYRGRPVVAVDLCELTLGRPARELLSTRIIVVKCQLQEGQESGAGHQAANPPDTLHLAPHTFSTLAPVFGLIVERATGMMRREARDVANSGLTAGEAPQLGPVMMDDQGVIQLLQAEHLLTDSVRTLIFPETAGGAQAPLRPVR